MTTIVTRAGKGSALTWTEGDSNFTNLNTAKLENVVEDLTPQLGGDLDVNGKKIVSVTNGNIEIDPNGSGQVIITVTGPVGGATARVTDGTSSLEFSALDGQIDSSAAGGLSLTTSATNAGIQLIPNGTGDIGLSADTVVVGDSGATATITSNGTGNLVLNTNSGTNSGTITIAQGINSNITLAPNGTGDVLLTADTVVVGDANASATLTTNGTGDLVLNTNSGTNAGSITLANGANGNITIAPNGTGLTLITGVTVGVVTATADASTIIGRHTATGGGTRNQYSFNVQKHRTNLALASMTDEPAVIAFSVRDSTNVNRIFARLMANYNGPSTNPYFMLQHSRDDWVTTNTLATLGAGTATWGLTGGGYTHTTLGTGNLTLSTNSGTNSGTIVITQGTNANITITPNGTGKTVITNAVPYELVFTGLATTGTITPNAANGTIQSITLSGSITLNAFATPLAGQTITLIIKQPAAGGPYTLTSTMLFAGGSKTLSTAANAVDILSVTYDGTNYWASLSKGYA